MYYRLRKQFLLRGWDRLPTGVVDTSQGQVHFETVRNFDVLRLCNGMLNSDSFFFSDEDRNILNNLEKYLDKSDEPMEPISERQKYRRYDNRFIRSVHWSITGKCNYNCKHCYMAAPEGVLEEVSLEDAKDIVDQMSNCGVVSVSLTGGEAMVHPYFWEIVDYILEKGIHLDEVYSNGFLVNEDTLNSFEERGIKPEFSLSFDGTGGWHSWLRGIEAADEHIERAFKLCRDKGFPTNAEMCLHKGNADRLGESIDYLAGLGCGLVKVNRLELTGNAQGIADIALDTEEAAELFLEYLPLFFEKGRPMGLQLGSMFLYHKRIGIHIPGYKYEDAIDESKYCMCGHARDKMYISCEGRVLPCIPFDSGKAAVVHFEKIKDVPLKRMLTDSYYFTCISTTLDKYFEHNPGCAVCEHRYHCAGGCRGCVNQECDEYDFLAVDEENCFLHRKGYYKRVIEICEEWRKRYECQRTNNRTDE